MHPNPGYRSYHGHHHHPVHHRRPQGGRAGTIAALGAILLLSCWAGTTTLYILFRDDALKAIAGRQVELSHAYDTQVVSLKAEIERLKSLKLVDQERVDRKLAQLSHQQSVLEGRHAQLQALAAGRAGTLARDGSPEITGSIPASLPSHSAPAAPSKPTPLSDATSLLPPMEKRPQPGSGPDAPPGATGHEAPMFNLAQDLEKIERDQSRALNETEERISDAGRRMRTVFADLGMKAPKNDAWFGAASGGPFLPFLRAPEDPFARQLQRVRATADEIEILSRGLATLPVRRPLADISDVTSGFGMRIDPFVRQLAMHTGVDMRAEPGEPVRAAAAGKVTEAGKNGGYGLMVEIDHGNGLTTRYAHLSAIEAGEGMSVKPGQVVGRVGTTGRSTGPHLHYEVRLNGDAIDPQKYLRAGLRLFEPR